MVKRKKRRIRGGAIRENDMAAILRDGPGENNLNAIRHLEVGENNLNAIKNLQAAKRPLQPPGQIVQPLPMPIKPLLMPIQRQNKKGFFQGVHDYVKSKRLISRGLRTVGLHGPADFAHQAGYGRKRKMRGGVYAFRDRYGAYVPLIKI